jgi:hypothetical protein
MPQQRKIADRILKAVHDAPGCRLDDLESYCPGLTWNQVFLEVDRLSRAGHLQVQSDGGGTYTLKLARKSKSIPHP